MLTNASRPNKLILPRTRSDTPDDKGRMAKNFKGYDISPDMVRLSLVNLYLHGFTDPHIYEYDTLTSEERWNESADVILANPPFMSPKGGIKPHKRFSIQAKRSEVLFVDYIAEQLTPTGRAGIIVPEGIIFQSQTAYKELRKMLVNQSLVAVISLPAGCFNPYSGVKTSILILDKSLAKQAGSVAFFKIENDGYGLGAQRRAVANSDLPQVKKELDEYLSALRQRRSVSELSPTCGLIVTKEKLAANGEFNLSGERYREGTAALSAHPHVSLDQVVDVNPESANPADLYPGTYFNYIDISCVENESGKFLGANRVETADAPSRARRLVSPNDVLLSTVRPNLKAFTMLSDVPDRAIASTGFAVLRAKPERLSPGFLIAMLRHDRSVEQMIGMSGKGAYPSVNQSDVESIQIPLPPLEVQKEIVAEIAGYQKVIDGARAVLDHYRPHIPIDPDWPELPLGEICRFIDYRGKTPEKTPSGIPLITAKNVRVGYVNPEPREFIADADYEPWMTRGIPQIGDVLFTMEAPLGNVAEITMTGRFALAQRLVALCPNRSILIGGFLKDVLLSGALQTKIMANQSGTTVYGIKASTLKTITIPVPSLATQQAIVAEIEAEQALVNGNRELITRFEQKIQTTLARVWGE